MLKSLIDLIVLLVPEILFTWILQLNFKALDPEKSFSYQFSGRDSMKSSFDVVMVNTEFIITLF